MSSITAPEPRVTDDPVRNWRFEQLQEAGYPFREALVLSQQDDVDLHVAVGLLRNGCPVATALRILL